MRNINLLVILAILLGLSAPSVSAAPFKSSQVLIRDVSPTHWAYDSVKEVVEDYQIMQGDGNGNFGGYRNMSRYELAATIANLIQFYNEEFAADREDLSSLANIMEQFQEELRILEARMASLNDKVANMEHILDTDGVAMKKQVAANTESIGVLEESGFIFDKLIKGTARDIKHVSYGFNHEPRWERVTREKSGNRYEHKKELSGDVGDQQWVSGEIKNEIEGEVLSEVESSIEDDAYLIEE